jgi:hypothetical protein
MWISPRTARRGQQRRSRRSATLCRLSRRHTLPFRKNTRRCVTVAVNCRSGLVSLAKPPVALRRAMAQPKLVQVRRYRTLVEGIYSGESDSRQMNPLRAAKPPTVPGELKRTLNAFGPNSEVVVSTIPVPTLLTAGENESPHDIRRVRDRRTLKSLLTANLVRTSSES